MSNEENEILAFLKRFSNRYVSVPDISKCVGPRKKFNEDRFWVQPILRRMELEKLVECSPFGEYRIRDGNSGTTTFIKALETPGTSLGDTTIIAIERLSDDSAPSF